VAVKIFPPKNLYIYIYTGVGYQMSLLLLADPGTQWARSAEPWVAGPSSYHLYHKVLVQRIILISEFPDEL